LKRRIDHSTGTTSNAQTDGARGAAAIPSAHADMAPTARRLLEAARRLFERSGYEALSLEEIGREAGENKSLIWYHFGGKPQLLVALSEWLIYEAVRSIQSHAEGMSPGVERQQAVWDDCRELAADSQVQRLYFELLPHLLDDRKTRRRLADLYARYRMLLATGLSLDDGPDRSGDERALASMLVALADGLAIQLLADPGSVDMVRVEKHWQTLVQVVLGSSQERSDQTLKVVAPQQVPRHGGQY
jgi:AcrR family transcriptional regulator